MNLVTINPVTPITVEERTREYQRLANAPNTIKAYRSDYLVFQRWAAERGERVFPEVRETSPELLAHFLTDQADEGLTAATVGRRLAAVAWTHRRGNAPPPITEQVRQTMAGIMRSKNRPPAFKRPLMRDDIVRIVDAIPASDLQVRALFLFGFASALRCAELAALRPGDLELREQGYLVHVADSKTDQEHKGEVIGVLRGLSRDHCPVLAVEQWLAVSRLPTVFGLSRRMILYTVKKWAARVGMAPAEIGVHSLRSGWITSALMVPGSTLPSVMEHARHRKMDSTLRYFHGRKFRDHPGYSLL